MAVLAGSVCNLTNAVMTGVLSGVLTDDALMTRPHFSSSCWRMEIEMGLEAEEDKNKIVMSTPGQRSPRHLYELFQISDTRGNIHK